MVFHRQFSIPFWKTLCGKRKCQYFPWMLCEMRACIATQSNRWYNTRLANDRQNALISISQRANVRINLNEQCIFRFRFILWEIYTIWNFQSDLLKSFGFQCRESTTYAIYGIDWGKNAFSSCLFVFDFLHTANSFVVCGNVKNLFTVIGFPIDTQHFLTHLQFQVEFDSLRSLWSTFGSILIFSISQTNENVHLNFRFENESKLQNCLIAWKSYWQHWLNFFPIIDNWDLVEHLRQHQCFAVAVCVQSSIFYYI